MRMQRSWYILVQTLRFRSEHPTLPKQMRYQTALHAVCQEYSNLTSIPPVKLIAENSPEFPTQKPEILVQIRDKKRITADAVQIEGAPALVAGKGVPTSHRTEAPGQCAWFSIDVQSQFLSAGWVK